MLDRRLHRCGTWLGLFALWLLLAGPLLSQSLASRPGDGHGHAHASMPQHAAEPSHHHVAGPSHAHADEALWAACGYCTLLFSCPAIQPPALLTGLPPFAGAAPPTQRAQGFPRPAAIPGARPRAPPPTLA
ncbi:DUF2946 domain-containing protein [Stutzerimonas azotifigens]|uniref:DUF2946 domain-containing protein n=1 Tax=Stutzerimonas azotifigens TaxID=291995 RepID=UPI00040D19FE|nr:DUF2946 domain-containing protein [Stutzerimonas azotifigens]